MESKGDKPKKKIEVWKIMIGIAILFALLSIAQLIFKFKI